MFDSKRLRSPFIILTLITLLGLGLRLVQLDFQPLWWDEGYSVWFASHSIAEMARLTAADIHPPLYYALLHLWTAVFGLKPLSLRLFSVLVSLPAIPLAYALGRDMRDRATGYLAAAAVALNPFAIFYAQEIRMYGLAATLSLAAIWTGWRWGKSSRKGARMQRKKMPILPPIHLRPAAFIRIPSPSPPPASASPWRCLARACYWLMRWNSSTCGTASAPA